MTFEKCNERYLHYYFEAVNSIRQALEHKFENEFDIIVQDFIKLIFTEDFDSSYTFNQYDLTANVFSMANLIDRINSAYYDDGDICFIEFGDKYPPKVFFESALTIQDRLFNELSENKSSTTYSVDGINWNYYHAITKVHCDISNFIERYNYFKSTYCACKTE